MKFYTKEVEGQYVAYQKKRISTLRGLIAQVVLWGIFTSSLIYKQLGGLQGARIGIEIDGYKSSSQMFYELPLFWLLLLLIQFSVYYAASIPLLSKWQDYLERKEFERLKKTYEYQLKLKDETTSNSHC